ncbi:alternative ribosome rescue aminoacyl-tRNA hydrolase ArfB [Desulfogranum marinum]|uniref:alternative ribosome rescue aminoacyl-tRNA hydrolase ArfB n=1 Tax=Desulfogranum marinum TaxID=453220 RepID=UPI0019657CED|nr:alternative ribosome rescue aminoacyl-tRNA hydrolase ArfB [Desulfogranum marinum]MBM9512662.1 aminoacyl-tRNA hydrolase [Desulfogranum marinum]
MVGDVKQGSIATENMVAITPSLAIPLRELEFRFSRSGGPGGQNVNKVNSKVTLFFNISQSQSLSSSQKSLLSFRLASRISQQGVLQLAASEHRTQKANKDAVILRFAGLLRQALVVQKPRKKTKPSRGSKERRITSKKKRAVVKQQRRKVNSSS